MKIISYPDGGKFVVNDLNEESLTYRINSYEDLFLLKSIKDANPNLKEITIPCMFQQQHDMRFNKNESFELKLVCDFIKSLGFKKIKVFHPHSSVTPALLDDGNRNCEVISNTHFIKNVLNEIYQINNPQEKIDEGLWYHKKINNLILMSSDAGGFKPLIKLCKELNWEGETYSATKSRERDKLTQLVDRTDFDGKDVILIDDICVGGGTFIGLAKLLKERNVGNLYLAVSHITIPNPNPELWQHFKMVYTTNSKGIQYGDYNDYHPKNLKVFDLF
jgi:ribose-phosphate pyrophosphokinase